MLNLVALMGRLVADPELRHSSQGTSVTAFTVAVDRSFVKQGAEKVADFIEVVAWRNTAEFVCKYFQKGSLIALEGNIQTRMYQDKNGNNRKAFEVVAQQVHFVGKKKDVTPSTAQNSPSPSYSTPAYSSGNNEDFISIQADDEDLPF